ncbi:ribonucleotide reductase subunit alpha [Massilia luteola]|uniref:ribonucleotide reductase subunit alpha n=1 Tax=Massilia luteola TaxID=3081751 RepID=UPI002ACC17F5|nr:ribonucleotide reductase subunit alpha [Massilia sp. Gc5]
MQLTDFADFLAAARAQPDAQRLLFVFAVAELPQAHTPGQARRFEEGRGGALAPVMCVDKGVDELDGFAALAEESRATGQPWDMVFVAALAAGQGVAPQPAGVDRGLRMMVDAVHRGAIERFLAFDPAGGVVRFA